MRTGVDFEVSDEQRGRLEAIAADGKSRIKHVRRARIILLTDDGPCGDIVFGSDNNWVVLCAVRSS